MPTVFDPKANYNKDLCSHKRLDKFERQVDRDFIVFTDGLDDGTQHDGHRISERQESV
jgi:hypothetical protein